MEQCGGEYCFVEYFELEWYFFYLTPTLGKWTHTTLKIRGFEKILNLNLIISLRKQNKGLEPIRIFRIPFWKDNTKNICAFLNFFRLFWNMIGDYIWGLRTFLSSFLIEISKKYRIFKKLICDWILGNILMKQKSKTYRYNVGKIFLIQHAPVNCSYSTKMYAWIIMNEWNIINISIMEMNEF